jgi:hypothetical protein
MRLAAQVLRRRLCARKLVVSELAQRLGHDDPVIGLRIVSRLTEDAVQIRLDRSDMRVRAEPERLFDPFDPDGAGDEPAGRNTT